MDGRTPNAEFLTHGTMDKERSTHFLFDHKIFSIPGSVFKLSEGRREALYYVPLGDMTAGISLPSLRSSFDIESDSHDAELLNIIQQSLRFVREIRPNDSIPCEILDGSASWSVEPHHHATARNRLTLQLLSWIHGDNAAGFNLEQLDALSEDADARKRIQDAFAEAAEKLGLGRERKQDVVDQIDYLARELAFIEALRDHYEGIREIFSKICRFQTLYTRDRGISEELSRMRALMEPFVETVDVAFDQIEAQTGEIGAVLKNLTAQVEFIRQSRDDLHEKFMIWEEMAELWRDIVVDQTPEAEAAFRKTYRFLAQNFVQQQEWRMQRNA